MIILLIGTAGSGKTTIGKKLAEALNWRYVEADDFHLPSSVETMRSGRAISPEAREPWLRGLRGAIDEAIDKGEDAIVVASALSEAHRTRLRVGDPEVKLVYLKGSEELIRQRIRDRKGHFAGEGILDDQFERLEEPKDAVIADISHTPDQLVRQIINDLGLAAAD